MTRFKIKNWARFQHYKQRRPPWIKLYRELLDDPDYHGLDPMAAKLLPLLWLVASESNGILPASNVLAFRLHLASMTLAELDRILQSLVPQWLEPHASNMLASCYQDAIPETETETETEGEAEQSRGGAAAAQTSLSGMVKEIKSSRPEFRQLRDMTIESVLGGCPESLRRQVVRDFVENVSNMVKSPDSPIAMLKAYVRKAASTTAQPDNRARCQTCKFPVARCICEKAV